ncbi:unnamed protein product, partial [Ascophyllum nodosum]
RGCGRVDLNLRLPKKIARKGNYGALPLVQTGALREDRCDDAVRPVTVKIRALEKDADTLYLVRRLETRRSRCSLSMVARSGEAKTAQGAANWDIIAKVKRFDDPCSGERGVETRADAESLLEATGADAVMSSEGLLEDPSLF